MIEIASVHYESSFASDKLADALHKRFSRLDAKNILFFCIGTDRSTGDSFGPFLGTALQSYGYNVLGTLDSPVHAVNLLTSIAKIPKGSFVVAVDACLGKLTSVGNITIGEGPLKPGAGVNKDLPPVGDINISMVVNIGGFMEYMVLQNTKLSLVYGGVTVLSGAVHKAMEGVVCYA